MTRRPSSPGSARLLREVGERLRAGRSYRRALAGGGRLYLERPLPFLCVYRRRPRRADPATERLVRSEASHLIVSGAPEGRAGAAALVERILGTLGEAFGAVLLLEVASTPGDPRSLADEGLVGRPGFVVRAARGDRDNGLLDTFAEILSRVRVRDRIAEVETLRTPRVAPGRLPALIGADTAEELACSRLCLEVREIYRDACSGDFYPLVLRDLHRELARALRRFFYEFTRTYTTHRPRHFHVLGRRALVKSVWDVDRKLADVSDSFDFLLQVTPLNAESAWQSFRRSGYDRSPTFHYRPLTAEPALLKRALYAAPLDRIEDPALGRLFREKQDEIGRHITMLSDLNTPNFVLGSLQVYGGVDRDLHLLARGILDRVSPRTREGWSRAKLDAAAFAHCARAELEHYRRRFPAMTAGVEIRDDLSGGLMVSHGSLLVGRRVRIPGPRVDALLQHEIGTHVVTYWNGRAQPFRQLYTGLARYEAMQEGLAVLAEHLVGGLSRKRLRVLAARVVAAASLIDGAEFVDTFRLLTERHHFERRSAFTIAMRIHRGGGLTKDAVYLRGLRDMMDYLAGGGRLEPLFVGKIAEEYLPVLQELELRGVLRSPPLRPRYMDRPETAPRLAQLRSGLTIPDLVRRSVR